MPDDNSLPPAQPSGTEPYDPAHPKQQVQAPDGSAAQGQGVGTGFVNLQTLLMANRPGAQSMANGLVGDVNAKADAYNNRDPSQSPSDQLKQAKGLSDSANALGSFGGIQASLQDKYKNQSYTGGQSGFDALISGAAGQPQFQQAQQAYGGLYKQLLQNGISQPAAAPTAPAQAPTAQRRDPSSAAVRKAYRARHTRTMGEELP